MGSGVHAASVQPTFFLHAMPSLSLRASEESRICSSHAEFGAPDGRGHGRRQHDRTGPRAAEHLVARSKDRPRHRGPGHPLSTRCTGSHVHVAGGSLAGNDIRPSRPRWDGRAWRRPRGLLDGLFGRCDVCRASFGHDGFSLTYRAVTRGVGASRERQRHHAHREPRTAAVGEVVLPAQRRRAGWGDHAVDLQGAPHCA